MQSTPLIIDVGSGFCKAGMATDSLPRSIVPSVVGRPMLRIANDDTSHVGNDVLWKRGVFRLSYPIESGVVTHWDDMDKIWNHIFFNELRVSPEEHSVLLSEAPLTPKENKEKVTQIMFETFTVPALYIAVQSALSLYASGRTTGLVLDYGDGVSYSVPVIEGYIPPHGVHKVNLSGRDLTDYLMKILRGRGYSFGANTDREVATDIKEKICYISMDFEEEVKQLKDSSKNLSYMLPDGETLTIDSELLACAEGLFQPNIIGKKEYGIHEVAHKSILESVTDTRMELYSNILLSGGTTMFEGIAQRLKKELNCLAHDFMTVRVNAPPDRIYYPWLGGTILASLSSFQDMWITKQEYEEFGAGIVHRKCF